MTSKDAAPKRAVIYTRISKDRNEGKESGEGLGVGKQEADCRELAARLGFDVAGVWTDNDLTAFKGGSRSKPRPGYKGLLEDIRSGSAQVVLAWHTDRLHRDLAELEEYVDTCQPRNTPTYTVKGGNLDLSTASGRMVARILGAVAKQEVEHMIERIGSAKERNRKAGAWGGGGLPYGYRPDGPSIKNGGEGRLAQVPAEAAMLREAYARVLAGEALSAIAGDFSARGLRTRQAAATWNPQSLRSMLLRASNAALITHTDPQTKAITVVGPANWEPIVDEDTWRAACAVLTDPARRTTPGPKPRHLLTGVLSCGVCGGNWFRTQGGGKQYRLNPAYVCSTPQRRADGQYRVRGCVRRTAAPLDEFIEFTIIERLSRPDALSALTGPAVDLAALDARRGVLNAQLNQIAATRFTIQQKADMSAPLLDELEQVEAEISRTLQGSPLAEFGDGRDPYKVWFGDESKGQPPLPMERRRAVARKLLRVTLLPVRSGKKPPGWRPGMRWPFDDTAIRITSPDGRPWGAPE